MGFAISQYHLWVSQEHPFLVNVLWNLCKKHHRCSLLFVDERESNGLTKKQSVYIQVFVFVKCKNSCKKIYLWLKSHKKFYECDEVHACSHCFFVVLLSYLAARKNMHITLFDMAANCRNLGEFLKDPAFSICESAKWIFLPFQDDFLGG